MSHPVFITRTAVALPNDPVDNEQIEARLGQIDNKPSRAKRVVLRSNGIRTRYYAIDPQTGEQNFSNAQLTAQAIRNLGADLGHSTPVDSLATGTSLPDQLMPNHAVMVHGELAWPRLATVACAGICLAGMAALRHAWLEIKSGEAQRSIATGSEIASAGLRGHFYEAETAAQVQALEANPQIAFEKDFLRWMLSDGAGALLLESQAKGPCPLEIEWMELSSAANEYPACMYLGADRDAQGQLISWLRFSAQAWGERSIFAVKQDVKLLNENIVRATLSEPLSRVVAKRGLRAEDVDWFLPHLSSFYFADPVAAALRDINFSIPRERWFTNLAECGNTGSASAYIMLDALVRSGRLQAGQRILMFVPESGRFSAGFVLLRVHPAQP